MSSIPRNICKSVPRIRQIRNMIKSNQLLYVQEEIINLKELNDDTISIVMTTHNRVKQTMFTLKTISESQIKNVQVIIVDDSTEEFLSLHELATFDFQINYIKIDNRKKEWVNPCVNYNIGFLKAKGNKLIIQNSEVCHIGDIIVQVNNYLHEGQYFCFDVKALNNFDLNEQLYQLGTKYQDVKNFLNQENSVWYQHSHERNLHFHFLTAITRSDFDKLGDGFDWDFSFGASCDDNEFVDRIEKILRLEMININNETKKIMGIHQFHSKSLSNKAYEKHHRQINRFIYQFKRNWFANNNNWVYLTNYSVPELKSILK